MNSIYFHTTLRTVRFLAIMLLAFSGIQSTIYAQRLRNIQQHSLNIRLKPLKTLDELKSALMQSSIASISQSNFHPILPYPFRIVHVQD